MIQQLPVEDVAKRFKYVLDDSCLLASVLFSLTLQFKGTDQRDAVLDDARGIVNGRQSLFDLECRLRGQGEDPYADQAEKLRTYLAFGGYTIKMGIPSREGLAAVISTYPLVYLLYPRQEFFGMPTPFYLTHIFSAVRLEGTDLVFFEPRAGEIRTRPMSMIETMWTGIGVVKKQEKIQTS